MAKKKIVDFLLAAIAALIAAAKSVIKLISCIGKMKPEPTQA